MSQPQVEISRLFIGKANVRRSVGDITELTKSIEKEGVIQPIIVRPAGAKYEIIVGSRRFQAAKAAGLKRIPAIIREISDDEAAIYSLSENIQRNNLEPEEEAEAYDMLMKNYPEKYGTQEKLAKELGVDHSRISRMLAVLELVSKVRAKVKRYAPPTERREAKAIPLEHATMLAEAFRTETVKRLPKEEFKEKQEELAREIAPLNEFEARKVVDEFKMTPEKPVEEIKEKALARETGVVLHEVYLAPKIAKALSKAADERGITMEELVSTAVEQWLKQAGYIV